MCLRPGLGCASGGCPADWQIPSRPLRQCRGQYGNRWDRTVSGGQWMAAVTSTIPVGNISSSTDYQLRHSVIVLYAELTGDPHTPSSGCGAIYDFCGNKTELMSSLPLDN